MPPFRADHVGSLQRPENLNRAARNFRDGEIDEAEFKGIQDAAIAEAVANQEALGLRGVTDGEFRRRGWSAGFIDAVSGFGLRDGTLAFRDEAGEVGIAKSPYAHERLRRGQPIVADDYRYLASIAKQTPKVTIPSPPVMHYFLGPQSWDEGVYADREDYFSDLVAIYREEIAELSGLGCTYLQFDDTALPCNCDDRARADVGRRGEDADELTRAYVALINGALADKPEDMTVTMHLCRGNLKGAWMAEGGYGPIAEQLFNDIAVDGYFLEYDTPRAGDFTPLRFVPKGKRIVLGLISSKSPELESKDDLKRRIDEAAEHLDLDQLCLSPQCGFSSAPGRGQSITRDDERRKIELIVDVARDVWGEI